MSDQPEVALTETTVANLQEIITILRREVVGLVDVINAVRHQAILDALRVGQLETDVKKNLDNFNNFAYTVGGSHAEYIRRLGDLETENKTLLGIIQARQDMEDRV